jgi:hypothetical protein
MAKTEKELKQAVEQALKETRVTSPSLDEVRKTYRRVLERLEELEQQPMAVAAAAESAAGWDVRIIRHVGGRITAMKGKLVESANELFRRRDEVDLFTGLAFQGARTRGIERGSEREEVKKGSTPEQFAVPIDGGKLEIVLEERDGKEGGLKIQLAVISDEHPDERVKEFYCTLEDMETGTVYFQDKRVDRAYRNSRIDDGEYRITVKTEQVAGSAVLKIGR